MPGTATHCHPASVGSAIEKKGLYEVIIKNATSNHQPKCLLGDCHGAVGFGGTPLNGFMSIDVAVEFQDGLIRPDGGAQKCWCLGGTFKEVVRETQTPVLIVLIFKLRSIVKIWSTELYKIPVTADMFSSVLAALRGPNRRRSSTNPISSNFLLRLMTVWLVTDRQGNNLAKRCIVSNDLFFDSV